MAFVELSDNPNDALDLVLHPQVIENEVLAYAMYVGHLDRTLGKTWAGPLLNGRDAWKTDRLKNAREYWRYVPEDRKFLAVLGTYLLEPQESDVLECVWKDRRTLWTWSVGDLRRTYPDII